MTEMCQRINSHNLLAAGGLNAAAAWGYAPHHMLHVLYRRLSRKYLSKIPSYLYIYIVHYIFPGPFYLSDFKCVRVPFQTQQWNNSDSITQSVAFHRCKKTNMCDSASVSWVSEVFIHLFILLNLWFCSSQPQKEDAGWGGSGTEEESHRNGVPR